MAQIFLLGCGDHLADDPPIEKNRERSLRLYYQSEQTAFLTKRQRQARIQRMLDAEQQNFTHG